MSDDRKSYDVNIGGTVHTVLLTKEDAARYGNAVESKQAKPANKAATPANKGA